MGLHCRETLGVLAALDLEIVLLNGDALEAQHLTPGSRKGLGLLVPTTLTLPFPTGTDSRSGHNLMTAHSLSLKELSVPCGPPAPSHPLTGIREFSTKMQPR